MQIVRLDEMDQKMETVKDDLKLVSRQLEDSVESQHGISYGLIALQHNSKKQFEDIGVHLLTTAENVSELTSAMSDIKAEFVKLSQFMRDSATRQLAQGSTSVPTPHSLTSGGVLPATASDVTTQSAPSSSCDNSIGSIQSKKSQAARPVLSITLPWTLNTTILRRVQMERRTNEQPHGSFSGSQQKLSNWITQPC